MAVKWSCKAEGIFEKKTSNLKSNHRKIETATKNFNQQIYRHLHISDFLIIIIMNP